MRFFKELQFSLQRSVVIYKLVVAFELVKCFKDVTFLSKKLSWPLCLKVETQLPSVWKEHHLFERNVLLTKNHQKEN